MTPRSLFLDHPNSLGETYAEHRAHALTFAGGLFAGAVACLVHAFVPGLCEATASRAVSRLHDRMTARQQASTALGEASARR